MLNTHAEATFQIPGRDQGSGGSGPAEAVHAAGGGGDGGADRDRACWRLYSRFTANAPVGTAGTPITEATGGFGGDGAVCGQGAGERAEVSGGESGHLFAAPADSAIQRIQTAGEAGLRALVDGAVGKMKDFYIFRSQFVPKTGTRPVTTHNLAFAKNAIGLVVRRLPQPLPGTGAIAEYAELGNFGMRVTMSYQPNTLAQQFTVDVLYGAAVLRNNFGVQVTC